MLCEIPKGSDVVYGISTSFYGINAQFLWHKHFLWQRCRNFQAVGDSTGVYFLQIHVYQGIFRPEHAQTIQFSGGEASIHHAVFHMSYNY